MYKSLLPSNSTILEKALEAATARAYNLDVEIKKIWNPDTCPVHLLPYLAWSLGVSLWNTDWDEKKKRQIIKVFLLIRAYRGTGLAINLGFQALGVRPQIIRWFEKKKKENPYTFDVYLWRDDNKTSIFQNETKELVEKILDETKSKRDHYKLNLGVRSTAKMGMKCIYSTARVKRIEMTL